LENIIIDPYFNRITSMVVFFSFDLHFSPLYLSLMCLLLKLVFGTDEKLWGRVYRGGGEA
jgi:hypothetical protein